MRLSLALLLLAAFPALLLSQEAPPEKPASVFDVLGSRRSLGRLEREMQAAFAEQKFPEAEAKCRELLTAAPKDPQAHYNLACALARQAKADEAIAALKQAVDLGFTDSQHIQLDDDLASLATRDDFRAIVAAAKKAQEGQPAQPFVAQLPAPPSIEPAKADKGEVIVGEKNTVWDQRSSIFRVYFDLTRPAEPPAICDGLGEAGDLLRTWWKEGTAAGNVGDFYDNHDTDHSNMDYGRFPQLTRIEFSPEAKNHRWHHGLQSVLFYNGVTLGNSSTALVNGPIWRSQPRLALTNPRHAAMLAAQYFGNHIYFYPEHRDHDEGHNGASGGGHGDVYAMNTPYVVISQGSSGSDIAFMNAVCATLAAFRPEVKTKLREAGALMPAVQRILRASGKQVKSPDDYFTGAAHPTVFDAANLDVPRMVRLAHDLQAEALPPVVRIRVVEEDQPVRGRDYFDVAESERLLDTPAAIARVARSTQYWRRMVVSAEASSDVNGQPLKYRWAVLRGDPERITIKPSESGSTAEIRIGYHERRPVSPGSKLESNRVDIGVFAENGKEVSAPAFVTCFFIDHERRAYDQKQRISSVDYADPEASKNYVDPLVALPKRWRDEYDYAEEGALRGWTRIRGDARESFAADGRLITERDDAGAAKTTKAVRYMLKPRPNEAALIEQQAE